MCIWLKHINYDLHYTMKLRLKEHSTININTIDEFGSRRTVVWGNHLTNYTIGSLKVPATIIFLISDLNLLMSRFLILKGRAFQYTLPT